MCGIFGSFDKAVIDSLSKLNASRGSHSFSIMSDAGVLYKSLGEFDITKAPEGKYHICHVQAPTTKARGIESVHPAEVGKMKLWHNGIIKDFEVTRLQNKQTTNQSWDTHLLLCELMESVDALSDINGSFACVLYDSSDFYIFRNEISPLFYDDELSISSVKFKESKSLPPNKVFKLDLENKNLIDIGREFKTKENPYFFA